MESDIFAQRKVYTDGIVQKLAGSLRAEFGHDFDNLIADHTCIYATGSCGRGEMGPDSDLDAYVIRVTGDVSMSAMIEEAVKARKSGSWTS